MSTTTSSQTYHASAERQVNTYMEDDQRDAEVAALADGGHIVVWESTDDREDGRNIYAQRFNADGEPLGEEFLINTYTSGTQSAPDVIGLADGGFAVSWEGSGDQGSGVHVQRFHADGEENGPAIWVDDGHSHRGREAELTALKNGGFVVSWLERSADSGSYSVPKVRQYDQDGNAVTDAIILEGAHTSINSSITGLSDGGWVVVWRDGTTLVAQEYGDDGTPSGARITTGLTNLMGDGDPQVVDLGGGGFAIVARANSTDVMMQMFDSSGAAINAPVELVPDESGLSPVQPQDIDLAPLPDGGFVMVWHEIGNRGGVFVQVYGADGQPIDDIIEVNQYALGVAHDASVAVQENGDFVVTWRGQLQSGQEAEIYSRTFSIDELELQAMGNTDTFVFEGELLVQDMSEEVPLTSPTMSEAVSQEVPIEWLPETDELLLATTTNFGIEI